MRRGNPTLGRFDSCAAPLSQKWPICRTLEAWGRAPIGGLVVRSDPPKSAHYWRALARNWRALEGGKARVQARERQCQGRERRSTRLVAALPKTA